MASSNRTIQSSLTARLRGAAKSAARTARSAAGGTRRRLAASRECRPRVARVRLTGWDAVEIAEGPAGLVRRPAPDVRQVRLDDPDVERELTVDRLRVEAPDPASYDRLVGAALVRGTATRVRVRIDRVPDWMRVGARPPRIAKDQTVLGWRVTGEGLDIELAWLAPRRLDRALADIATALLRPGRVDQIGGELHPLDRAAYVTGRGTWPQAAAGVTAPDASAASDASGPFTAVPSGATDRSAYRLPLGTTIANPRSRKLIGTARRLNLELDGSGDRVVLGAGECSESIEPYLVFTQDEPVEHSVLSRQWDRYAVLELGSTLPTGRFVEHVLVTLAACGVVIAARSPAVRERLNALGITSVPEASQVADLGGYLLSAAASRRATLATDPMLRQTALATDYAVGGAAGPPSLPLPAVSALVASMRPDDLPTCLAGLAGQAYPELEVLVGTHGYLLDDRRRAELADRLGRPLRVVSVEGRRTLGEVLGTLSRHADGELLTKVDDDDHYGPDHVTDLLVASRQTGADLVAKAARFVHLAPGGATDDGETGVTVDRRWAAHEAFGVSPAGGTMLFSRATLAEAGGWSTSPRHVDADLIARIQAIGGITYRTHGLGYVYVRRSTGHTWQADRATLVGKDDVVYPGLPAELLAAAPDPGAGLVATTASPGTTPTATTTGLSR